MIVGEVIVGEMIASHYRRYHFRWMLEQIESEKDAKNLKMSTLLAIQYIIQAWNNATSDVISNWKATKILPDNNDDDSRGDEAQELNNDLNCLNPS